MSVDKLIDSTKLDACCTAEANAIRAKTGGSSQLSYDWANSKGFADAIAAIPSGGGGYTADDWLDNSKPVGDIRSSVYSVTGQYGTYVRLFNKTSIGRVIIEMSKLAFQLLSNLDRCEVSDFQPTWSEVDFENSAQVGQNFFRYIIRAILAQIFMPLIFLHQMS